MSSSEELKRQKRREYCARYRAENPDKFREYRARYRAKHPEKCREAYAIYTAKNREKCTEICRISRWKRRGINCDEEWDEVYDWWLNAKTCDICDKEFDKSRNKCLDHDRYRS